MIRFGLSIEAYLIKLATTDNVSSSTQNQAFSAILFYIKRFLGVDVSEWNIQALRAQERKYIPVVLTKEEVATILQNVALDYSLISFFMLIFSINYSIT